MHPQRTHPARNKTASPSTFAAPHSAAAWIPAVLGLLLICGESTRVMGADHTLHWLSRICSPVVHLANAQTFELNHVLRKCGHFFGYGTLGLVFMQGWRSLVVARWNQTWMKLRLLAGTLGVFSAALVACMDELHQSFLPNRTACFSDVLLDTAGSLLLIGFALVTMLMRRKRLLTRLTCLRATRQWQTNAWLFRDALLEQSR